MTADRSIDAIVADLISLPEAARKLKVDPETALRWAREGKFPGDAARKQGSTWVVSARRLDRYFHGDGHKEAS